MSLLRAHKRAAGFIAGVALAVSLTGAAAAQEFINTAPTGAPPETSYVRLALFPRASLHLSAAQLLAHLDAVKRAGATDVALDIWDMGTVPYAASALAASDSTVAAADPLATLTKGAFDRGLRCWLWPSAGLEVWRTPLTAAIDGGPFLRGRPTWAAVTRDGAIGFADTLAGVRRYTLAPTLRDVHQFFMKTILEAIGRYPVAGVLADNTGFPSLDYSFDGAANQLFMTQYDPVDPRGLTPADSSEWADWYAFRDAQGRALLSALSKNLRRQSGEPTLAAILHASPESREHIENLTYWNKRAALSWALVRPTVRTLSSLRAALDSTMRELAASTPDSSRRAPGLGLVLDGTAPDDIVRDQLAALGAAGGRIVAVPEAALTAAPERWHGLWTALVGMAVDKRTAAASATTGTTLLKPAAVTKKRAGTRTHSKRVVKSKAKK